MLVAALAAWAACILSTAAAFGLPSGSPSGYLPSKQAQQTSVFACSEAATMPSMETNPRLSAPIAVAIPATMSFSSTPLANGVDENDIVAGIATAIGADSLGFVSIDGMVAASEQAKTEVCCACFDGKYPLGLPEGNPNAAAVERMQAAQAAKAATSN